MDVRIVNTGIDDPWDSKSFHGKDSLWHDICSLVCCGTAVSCSGQCDTDTVWNREYGIRCCHKLAAGAHRQPK